FAVLVEAPGCQSVYRLGGGRVAATRAQDGLTALTAAALRGRPPCEIRSTLWSTLWSMLAASLRRLPEQTLGRQAQLIDRARAADWSPDDLTVAAMVHAERARRAGRPDPGLGALAHTA
ncbi:hypothetical protein, partial [Nakamurella sp.]|uniref:hypothetical protein n=1 Tax=Nakamurella sp. TaxID=1869182 RepID=UPI003B3B93E1